MRAGGSHITPEHAEDISLCGLFLMEVTKRVDREYSVHNGAAHTATNSRRDIVKLAEHLMSANIRSKTSFVDPTSDGLKKMTTTTWIQDTLNRNELLDDSVGERGDDYNEHGIDITYELADVV